MIRLRMIAACAALAMVGGCSSSPRSLTPDDISIGVGGVHVDGRGGIGSIEPEIGVSISYSLRERMREMGR